MSTTLAVLLGAILGSAAMLGVCVVVVCWSGRHAITQTDQERQGR